MIYFITGTDTDAGKTVVSSGLLQAANGQTLGLKPIAAGCEWQQGQWQNADALALQAASRIALPYTQINPIALAPAIAPHIAAAAQGQPLNVAQLTPLMPAHAMAQADLCLVEGAGGWRLPLNDDQTLAEWVRQCQWPVVLVVGMKLGCLNHALLTAEAIIADGVRLVGWIANHVDATMSHYQENLASLQRMLPVPMLAEVPFLAQPDGQHAAPFLRSAAAHLQQPLMLDSGEHSEAEMNVVQPQMA